MAAWTPITEARVISTVLGELMGTESGGRGIRDRRTLNCKVLAPVTVGFHGYRMMDYRSEVTGLSDKDGRFTGIRGPGGDQEEAMKQVFVRDCPDWAMRGCDASI